MVLKSSSAGQQWSIRHSEQTYGHSVAGSGGGVRRGWERGMERVTWKVTLPYVK